MSDQSIVEYFSEHEKYKCGYCGQKDTNFSHGMWTHKLTVEDYQALMDRGWRRSGKYTYKPTMDQTCCPQYCIRCQVLDYKPSKSQKKVIKRVNRFLNYGVKPGSLSKMDEGGEPEDNQGDGPGNSHSQVLPGTHRQGTTGVGLDPTSTDQVDSAAASSTALSVSSDKANSSSSAGPRLSSPPSDCDRTSGKKTPKQGAGADPHKPLCKKAKEIRLERRKQRLAQKSQGQGGQDSPVKKQKQASSGSKSLEDLLFATVANPVHKLELRLVRSSPRSRQFTETFADSYALYKAYQMTIHKDPPDKPTEKQYTRFLVDSPLEPEHNEDGFPDGFGSFHQHYLLDGKIIAVGVIDILPHSVSSVYLYYDPDYSFLSLGTYSALREIAFTRLVHTLEPSITYYYMGFYIHSCIKMRYKGQYSPSFILCPEAYSFEPIEQCRPKMEATNYARLSAPDKEDPDKDIDLDSVLVLHQRTAMPYAIYQQLNSTASDEEEVREYAGFVGKTCAERLILYRA